MNTYKEFHCEGLHNQLNPTGFAGSWYVLVTRLCLIFPELHRSLPRLQPAGYLELQPNTILETEPNSLSQSS